jgi:hypothetical protein
MPFLVSNPMKCTFLFSLLFIVLLGNSQVPDSWLGHYKGTLISTNFQGNKTQYAMELIVQPISDSSWTWTIVYGEDSLRQERQYQLILNEKGQFAIDEQNSILLSAHLIGNQFISVFEVQGNLIHTTYRFEKSQVQFKLTSSSGPYETGNTVQENNDTIPPVTSYRTVVFQQAELKKVKQTK